MNMTLVNDIAANFDPDRTWPALALLRDTPGRDERKWIEGLYASRKDADLTLPYHEKLNAPGMKEKIASEFASFTSIPSQYNISLPLFGGNHTTMGQKMALAKLVQDGAVVTDKNRLRWV